MTDYVNGYIERCAGGTYEGRITIDGVSLEGGIVGMYFKRDERNYLWLKRKCILEYDNKTMSYKEREAKPSWECYLQKQMDDNTVAYKGEFTFMRFRFSIVGVWDRILGTDKQHRLNLFVERLPMSQQTIINGIKERNNNATRNDNNTE